MDIKYKKQLVNDFSFIYTKYKNELDKGKFNIRFFHQLIQLLLLMKMVEKLWI